MWQMSSTQGSFGIQHVVLHVYFYAKLTFYIVLKKKKKCAASCVLCCVQCIREETAYRCIYKWQPTGSTQTAKNQFYVERRKHLDN